MDSLSDVFVEKAKSNSTNKFSALEDSHKNDDQMIDSLASKTDESLPAGEKISHKEKSVKDMKKEQKNIKKEVK